MTTSADLLAAARDLLKRTDANTAGLWPRAAALLARQALEQALDDYWREKGVPLDVCSMRPQLICLREYMDEDVAGRVYHAWDALSGACHQHPYELAPGHGELTMWLGVVGEILDVAFRTQSSGQ